MTDSTRDGLDRRTFLLATASAVGAGSAFGGVGAVSDGTGSADGGDWSFSNGSIRPSGFVLEQGDTCVPLGVVTSDMPVEEFYDYRSSDTDPQGWYSAYGPATALEQAENSVLYLYRGPEGTSLVFMHGKRGSEGGGSVTFRFSGLPTDGAWAVTDDQVRCLDQLRHLRGIRRRMAGRLDVGGRFPSRRGCRRRRVSGTHPRRYRNHRPRVQRRGAVVQTAREPKLRRTGRGVERSRRRFGGVSLAVARHGTSGRHSRWSLSRVGWDGNDDTKHDENHRDTNHDRCTNPDRRTNDRDYGHHVGFENDDGHGERIDP